MKPVKVVQSSKTVSSENGFGKYEITVQTARIEGVFGWIDFDKYADGFWQVNWVRSRHNIHDLWWNATYKASRELDDVVGLLDKLHQDLIEEWL